MILRSPMESDLEMAGQSSTESDLTDCEGMHVLIAEDNELNYEVAHEILAMHGITSEQAENGRSVLKDLWRHRKALMMRF